MKEFLAAFYADFLNPLFWVGGAAGAVLNFVFGDITKVIYWLLIMMLCDIITGVWRAAKEGDANSNSGFRGLTKKFLMLLIVGLCHGLDQMSVFPDINLRDICAFAYGLNEVGSIFENLELLGYGNAIPTPIRLALSVLDKRQRELIEGLKNEREETSEGS